MIFACDTWNCLWLLPLLATHSDIVQILLGQGPLAAIHNIQHDQAPMQALHKYLEACWVQCKEKLTLSCAVDMSSGNICYNDIKHLFPVQCFLFDLCGPTAAWKLWGDTTVAVSVGALVLCPVLGSVLHHFLVQVPGLGTERKPLSLESKDTCF